MTKKSREEKKHGLPSPEKRPDLYDGYDNPVKPRYFDMSLPKEVEEALSAL